MKRNQRKCWFVQEKNLDVYDYLVNRSKEALGMSFSEYMNVAMLTGYREAVKRGRIEPMEVVDEQ